MFIIYRQTSRLLRTTIFARNFSMESNQDQFNCALNLFEKEIKSMREEINLKLGLINKEMKNEFSIVKTEINKEISDNRREIIYKIKFARISKESLISIWNMWGFMLTHFYLLQKLRFWRLLNEEKLRFLKIGKYFLPLIKI
ncbi:hypothetical protein Mgra_00000250 [Meloidogyne graminicola]|uniref:Uncharacterized protein n=1 Tax=Meloidogyne graminicola TaxID=189291 RepID=A0A8T0A539_9BILA|nr:hypothetical protein Mgra_00000250 [Meloidogyne graminicola]